MWPRATPKRSATRAAASGETGLGVYLDFSDAIARLGVETIRERYGNLFDMYQRITDEDPYKVPMRIYPGDSLHDGRPVGGLQPAKHHSRPVRPRRSEFLRPRRQPPGRQRADAGLGRWLFRHAVHHRQLSGHDEAGQSRRRRIPRSRGRARRHSRRRQTAGDQRQAHRRFLPSRTGQDHVGDCGMARTAEGLEKAIGQIPRVARRILAERERAGQRRRIESEPRTGRPRGGLSGTGRAAVHRRAGTQRILRRPFPRGIPDPEGEAQRDDEHFATSRPGATPAPGKPADAEQRAAGN